MYTKIMDSPQDLMLRANEHAHASFSFVKGFLKTRQAKQRRLRHIADYGFLNAGILLTTVLMSIKSEKAIACLK